jgi:hypothetical protein
MILGLTARSTHHTRHLWCEGRLRPETLPDSSSLHWALWEAYRRNGQLKEATQELEKPGVRLLHSDERYRSLIRRIGLPPAH